ncbi:hypothetical protein NIES22_15810 [Calothrix brevissima NIES-22]|nr:hypothetical protein NIES22_15810 [Calothrix brevissima NIES-22]
MEVPCPLRYIDVLPIIQGLQVGKVQIIVDCRGVGTVIPRSAYLIYLKYTVLKLVLIFAA